MENPMTEVKNLIHQLEQVCDELANKNGIEHLAGPQGHVLYYLSQHSHQEVFVKDIEQTLRISKSVASNLVKRMVKNGFIEVVPSADDKRYKRLLLTEKGMTKIKPLKAFHEELQMSFFKQISKEDFETVHRVVHQLKANLDQYRRETDA